MTEHCRAGWQIILYILHHLDWEIWSLFVIQILFVDSYSDWGANNNAPFSVISSRHRTPFSLPMGMHLWKWASISHGHSWTLALTYCISLRSPITGVNIKDVITKNTAYRWPFLRSTTVTWMQMVIDFEVFSIVKWYDSFSVWRLYNKTFGYTVLGGIGWAR